MNKQTKVILLGYGHLGKWHAEKVIKSKEADLIGICDLDPAQRKKASENFPQIKITDDFEPLLETCDACIIVTPTSSHYKILKNLVEKNKHIFCEKPLCSTLKEAQEVLNLAKSKPEVFMVGHSERCHEIWELDVFKNESFQEAEFRRITPFKGRGGDVDVIQDLTIHDIDLASYLFKSSYKKLRTIQLEKSVTKYIDKVKVEAILENGMKVIFTTNRDASEEERSVIFDQEFEIDLMNRSYSLPLGEGKYTKRDHLMIEHQSFYKAIQEKIKPLTTFQEGANALNVIDKIYQSYELKSWVEFS